MALAWALGGVGLGLMQHVICNFLCFFVCFMRVLSLPRFQPTEQEENFCSESFNFLWSAVAYSRQLSREQRTETAPLIYQEFILPNGAQVVNIDSKTRQAVKEAFESEDYSPDSTWGAGAIGWIVGGAAGHVHSASANGSNCVRCVVICVGLYAFDFLPAVLCAASGVCVVCGVCVRGA